MSEKDFFLDIAMTKHPVGGQVEEVTPLPIPNRIFEECSEGVPYSQSNFWNEVGYKERLIEFHQELKELKNKYKPFMRDLLPEYQSTVKSKELKKFDFRYINPGDVFVERNNPSFKWDQVVIPDYRGPAGQDGKWAAWYKTSFDISDFTYEERRVILSFQCVDYIAVIYVNGNFVGRHEGFFAPFSFDVTRFVSHDKENELIIECQNDISMLGVGDLYDGDKIYAATGPGWDDSEIGWHHCPAGAGVFGKVSVEYRPEIHIDDIFVRSDIDNHFCELRIGIINYTEKPVVDYKININLHPKNFEAEDIGSLEANIYCVGTGHNEYRYRIYLNDFRLWEPDTPWLYNAETKLSKDNEVVSVKNQTFGIKKFVSDENSEPKGKFFFNNRPIILRGANEMGHLQQCVMKGDFDQLIDDILIAKLCNLNYYRVTQRPVQEEIYDYFDMLGMMHQCDLPLFSYLRRPQFCEAVRQTVEMEHLIRRHVSTIMVSFINEPVCIRQTQDPNDKFSKRYRYKGHRELLRDELEAFFSAARKAIYVENPDRVIKNAEGDYDPPTIEGMPDFHCYTMWYTNHGQPIGRLRRGYLPPLKPGWIAGCGEYGAEGLDNLDIMLNMYPKEWLVPNADGTWYPDKIIKSQTFSVHGDWYPEQHIMEDWIRESQNHQAIATVMLTDAFRRRGDIIKQTAIHLLIDAWPSGWMKTLLGCDRIPKQAYFSYRDSLIPLRVNLYCDKQYLYSGETVPVEAWLLNDTPDEYDLTIRATVRIKNSYGKSYILTASTEAATAVCAGKILMQVPEVSEKSEILLDACIINEKGEVLGGESLKFYVWPKTVHSPNVHTVGLVADNIGLQLGFKKIYEEAADMLISELTDDAKTEAEAALAAGKTVALLLPDKTDNLTLAGITLSVKPCQPVFFAACTPELEQYKFNMLYNSNVDYIDFIGESSIICEEGETLVYSYGKRGFTGSSGSKPKLPFIKKITIGQGTLYLVSLLLEGRIGCNANIDAFVNHIFSQDMLGG